MPFESGSFRGFSSCRLKEFFFTTVNTELLNRKIYREFRIKMYV